jgi:hypothetical protein
MIFVLSSDEKLKAYLTDSIPDYRLILMTTEDEASRK